MFIVKPDLSEEDRNALFSVIKDTVAKNGGKIASADLWSERRRLTFTIKKQQEGVYYLVQFSAPSEAVTKLKYAFKLNELILRVMILRVDE
jgi:small subunit ribosomal protein S6